MDFSVKVKPPTPFFFPCSNEFEKKRDHFSPCVGRRRRGERGGGGGELCGRSSYLCVPFSFLFSFYIIFHSNDPAQQLERPLAPALGQQRPQPPGEVGRVGHE